MITLTGILSGRAIILADKNIVKTPRGYKACSSSKLAMMNFLTIYHEEGYPQLPPSHVRLQEGILRRLAIMPERK